MKIQLVILIILVLKSYQDLPIHCLNSDVYGNWEFYLSEGKKLFSPIQNTCGHSIPDRENKSYLSQEYFEFKEDLKIKLELEKEGIVNYVMKQFQKSIKKYFFSEQKYIHELKMNNWTMIYDQGFQVNLQNGLNFFVYNKYQKNPNDSFEYNSNCQETLLGWFQDKSNSLYGCIKGKKISKSNIDINFINQFDDANSFRFKAQKNQKLVKNYLFLGAQLKITAKFKDHSKIVMRLNQVQNKWKAKNNEFVQNKTLEILNRQMGRRNKQIYIEEKRLIEQRQQYEKLLNKQDKDKLLQDLPHFFSWEDKLDAAIQQGECGSCYAIATASMINARLRIKYGQMANKFKTSIQQILDCNYYNQGCDGGYPNLVNKFGSEQILVNSSCMSYLQKDGDCSSICKDTELGVKILDYGYVGGRYGLQNITARDIMKEVMSNGPVVVSFRPNFELMYYGEGVYHPLRPAQYLSNGENKPEFQQIDHSVLCYGWGETNDGQMYWMLQNSWGDKWGDHGNFKIRLGIDEMSVESSAEYANPVFINLKTDLQAQIQYQFMQNLKQ